MKALKIDTQNMAVAELDLVIEANTIYSFFNSILIDELTPLNGHVIYTDANALSEKKRAYFIGEQLILGNALLLGREGFNDSDAIIKKSELESLVISEVNEFYRSVLELLSLTDIDLYRTFELIKDSESLSLNTEWVLYTFNIADIRTQEYFITELRKWLKCDKPVVAYMQKMATLAVNVGK